MTILKILAMVSVVAYGFSVFSLPKKDSTIHYGNITGSGMPQKILTGVRVYGGGGTGIPANGPNTTITLTHI